MAMVVLYTILQAAERLGVSHNTVQAWLWRGLLKRTKAGSRTLIAEDEIQRFLAASTERADNLRLERRAKKSADKAA